MSETTGKFDLKIFDPTQPKRKRKRVVQIAQEEVKGPEIATPSTEVLLSFSHTFWEQNLSVLICLLPLFTPQNIEPNSWLKDDNENGEERAYRFVCVSSYPLLLLRSLTSDTTSF